MIKNKIIIIFTIFLNLQVTRAQNNLNFPENCWGVYTWNNIPANFTPQNYPLIKGFPIILKWNEIEPELGKFKFDEFIRNKLILAEKYNYYTFLKIWVSPNVPLWLYQNGVPQVEMTKTIDPLGKTRTTKFQYYLDPEYIVFYNRLILEFGMYVQSLPQNLQNRILYIQSAEGSTGDGSPYKGEPLDPKYNISNEQWGDFRINAWGVFKQAFTNQNGEQIKPILVNQDSNTEKEYNWLLNNFNPIGLKHGMFSHGYDISDTKTRLEYWRNFNEKAKSKGIEVFARGEQDGEWEVYGWHKKNTELAFYWSGIFATYCGLDMWNLPTKAANGLKHEAGINFFNKYAGQKDPKTANVAFCAFRKGLNAADKIAYPESEFGVAGRKNINRYIKIASVYSKFGAYQGDAQKAVGGGMQNRQSKDYNDVGWDITEENYSRFIDQIDAEKTSDGWWHCGPQESIYGRFARSIKLINGKGGMFFNVNDEFSKSCKKVKLRIVWLDKGYGEWKLLYNSTKSPNQILITVKNSNSGKWKEKTVLILNAAFQNKGDRKSDISITTNSKETTIFHLLELEKK